MIDGNAATTYTNLKAYTINGKGVIVPGDANPSDSALECDLGIQQPVCGLGQMPQPPGTLNAAQRTTIDTWIKCGAPNN
jgi:hypothetical protein